MNFTFINCALACYFLACILYLFRSVFKIEPIGNISTIIISIGFASHTIHLISRWSASGRLPIISLYETIIFFVWSIALIYLILQKIYKLKYLEIPVSALAALALGYASVLDKSIQPLMPALKSNWLIIHVTSYFIGYAALALSFILSCAYLLISQKTPSPAPLSERLDNLSYRLITLAFPFLTLGLTTGAVWAKSAWGRYWSWDPKETWALITWIIYAAYLHLRLLKNWQGKRCAYITIIGFLCVLFTFFGVNYLLKGLHSYL